MGIPGVDDVCLASETPADCCGALTLVTGTPADDKIDATSGGACVDAQSGDDEVDGSSSADVVLGGAGKDEVDGGDGNDILFGGAGDDDIHGKKDSDVLIGGEGDDELDGGAGSDTLVGGPGDDLLKGISGDDTLDGGDGNDILEGGAGDDKLTAGSGDDTLDGGSSDDELRGGIGNDTLIGGAGDDTFWPGAGSDSVDAGSGADRIVLQATCELSAGETIDGGSGNDTIESPLTEAELAAAGIVITSVENFVVVPQSDAAACDACMCELSGGLVTCCGGVGTCDKESEIEDFPLACDCQPGFSGPGCMYDETVVQTPIGFECDGPDPLCDGLIDEYLVYGVEFTEAQIIAACSDIQELDTNDWPPEGENLEVLVYCPSATGCNDPASDFPLHTWGNATMGEAIYYGYLQEYLAQAGIASASVELNGLQPRPKGAFLLCTRRLLMDDWQLSQALSRVHSFGGHSSSGAGALFAATQSKFLQNPVDDHDFLLGATAVAFNRIEEAGVFSQFFGPGDIDGTYLDSALLLAGAFDSDRITVNGPIGGYDFLEKELPLPGGTVMSKSAIWVDAFISSSESTADVPSARTPHYDWGGRPTLDGLGASPEGRALAVAYVGGYLRWILNDETQFRKYFTDDEFLPTVEDLFSADPTVGVVQNFSQGTRSGGARRVLDAFERADGLNEEGFAPSDSGFASPLVIDALDTADATYGRYLKTGGALGGLTAGQSATLREEIAAVGSGVDLSEFAYVSFRAGIPFEPLGGNCVSTHAQDVVVDLDLLDSAGVRYSVSATDFARLELPNFDANDDFTQQTNPTPGVDDCRSADHLRTFRVPMSEFCSHGLDPSDLGALELVFTSAAGSAVMVDSIEFTRSDEDDATAACDDPGGTTGTSGTTSGGDPACEFNLDFSGNFPLQRILGREDTIEGGLYYRSCPDQGDTCVLDPSATEPLVDSDFTCQSCSPSAKPGCFCLQDSDCTVGLGSTAKCFGPGQVGPEFGCFATPPVWACEQPCPALGKVCSWNPDESGQTSGICYTPACLELDTLPEPACEDEEFQEVPLDCYADEAPAQCYAADDCPQTQVEFAACANGAGECHQQIGGTWECCPTTLEGCVLPDAP